MNATPAGTLITPRALHESAGAANGSSSSLPGGAIGTPLARDASGAFADADVAAAFAETVRQQLTLIGEDPMRDGLAHTPDRVQRSLAWLTRGYSMTARQVVGEGVFDAEGTRSMVMVRDIELYSMCEHHMLPFFGKAHIAYIPDGKIVGLSKIPRIVEVFARRLQVQERLTEQVAEAIEDVLQPAGVGVVIEATHLCMMMRGVEKQNSKTITSAVRGVFESDAKTRDEFLRLAHAR